MTDETHSQEAMGDSEHIQNVLLSLFVAWAKNKLTPVQLMLEQPNLNWSPEKIQGAAQTVYELCGSFCYNKDYEHYFFHLISIIEKLPNLTPEEGALGLKDLEAIGTLFSVETPETAKARRKEVS